MQITRENFYTALAQYPTHQSIRQSMLLNISKKEAFYAVLSYIKELKTFVLNNSMPMNMRITVLHKMFDLAGKPNDERCFTAEDVEARANYYKLMIAKFGEDGL